MRATGKTNKNKIWTGAEKYEEKAKENYARKGMTKMKVLLRWKVEKKKEKEKTEVLLREREWTILLKEGGTEERKGGRRIDIGDKVEGLEGNKGRL